MALPEFDASEFASGQPAFNDAEFRKPAKPPGTISYLAQQAKAGLTADVPEIAGKALQYTSDPGNTIYDLGSRMRATGEENAAANMPDANRGPITRFAASALRGAAPIIPLAAANLTPLGPAVDVAGAAALGAGYGASQGQDTLERARAAGLPEDQALSTARKTGAITGLGMGAVSALSGGLAAPVIRSLAGAGGKTAGEVLANSAAPGFMRPFVADTAGQLVGNTAGMAAANAGVAGVERSAGLEGPTPGQAALEGLDSGAGLTAALLPFGAARTALAQRANTAATANLQSGRADPGTRAQVAQRIQGNLEAVDPEAAQNFGAHAQAAIEHGQALDLGEHLFQPPAADQYVPTPGPMTRAAALALPAPVVHVDEQGNARRDGEPPPADQQAPVVGHADTPIENAAAGTLALPAPEQHLALPAPVLPVTPEGQAVTPEQRNAQREAQARQSTERQTLGLPQTSPGGDILNESGQPFRSAPGAARAARDAGPGFSVVKVDGGFVVRRAADNVTDVEAKPPPEIKTPIDEAAHAAATSPLNDLPQPSEAQLAAGNYSKGHVSIQGLDLSIENPKGSTRSGVSADGTPWSNTMEHHYGYLRGTIGNDKDHVDAFVGPNPESRKVFVVDQLHPDGTFDEHKALIGFDSLEEAKAGYLANYNPGWKGMGAITELPMPAFKSWVTDGTKKKPLGEIAAPAAAVPAPAKDPAQAAVQPAGGPAVEPAGAAKQSNTALTGEAVHRTRMQAAAALKKAGAGHEVVALPEGGFAVRAKEGEAPLPESKPLAVGMMPGNAQPVSVRDGIVHVGDKPALNFDTGEPVKVAAGARDEQVKQALRDAGALSRRQKFFGGEASPASFSRTPDQLREVRGSNQAKAAAKEFINKPLTNEATGLTATVSGMSLRKMLDASSVKRSVSPQAHMMAVGNLDRLFEGAGLKEVRAPKGANDEGLANLHHFVTPMPFDGRELQARIMAKEFKDSAKGTRLYLVQAVEIESAGVVGQDPMVSGKLQSESKPASQPPPSAEGIVPPAEKSGDAGFRRSDAQQSGLPVADVRKALALPLARLKVPYEVHDTVAAARLASGYSDIPADARGMYFKGKLHLFAEGLHTPLHAEEVFWHEVNHAGLDAMYGNRSQPYEDAMRGLANRNQNIRDAAKAWMDKYGKEDYQSRVDGGLSPESAMTRTKLQAVDEALAEMASRNMKIHGVALFVAKVQEFMRSIGLRRLANSLEGKTNAEALSMILRARGAVMEAKAPERAGAMVPSFNRAATLDAAAAAVDKIKMSEAAQHLDTAWDGLKRATAPQFRSDAAREVSRQIIAGMGSQEMNRIKFGAQLNKAIVEEKKALTTAQKARDLLDKGLTVQADKVFLKQTPEENNAFMQAMDSGDAKYFEAHPNLKGMADVIGKMFAEKAKEVQALDTGAMQHIRENYFPHVWKKEPASDATKQIYEQLSKRPLEGQKGFTKERVFDDVRAGLDAGFEPVSSNPLDLVALKMGEMDRYILAHRTLKAMEGSEAVHLIGAGVKTPEGYTDINGRFGSIEREGEKLRYVAREDVAQVINNYLSPSLYHNKYVGKPFTAYMGAANTLNQFQLGVFSAFHAGFTSLEAVISHGSIGIKALSEGDLKGAAKYLGSAPAAWINNPKMGSKIIEEMLNAGTHPEMAQILHGLELAGFKWQMDSRFRTDTTKGMLQAWQEGKKVTAAVKSIGALSEQSARPILEWLVPRQKFGVFGEMYNRWIEQNPNATHEEMRNSAQQIWNRVDSRLGQVVYDRLFVHNTVKNFAQMLVRAPGWTGGTILEVGGGIKDLAKYAADLATGKKPAGITDRGAYVLSMLLTTALVNATLTALFTGDAPDDWRDLVAFRTGNLDERGRPERFLLPSYVKDLLAYTKAPAETLVNKAHPLLSLIGDVARNRDFEGVEVRSEDDSIFTQLAETAGFAAKAFVPFWIKGVQKQQDREGSALAMAAPLVGVMAAPSDLNKTEAEKLMSHYAADRLPQGTRTQEERAKADLHRQMYLAFRKNEPDKARELFDQGREQGLFGPKDFLRTMRAARNDPAVNSFKQLTYPQAVRVMAVANDEEKQELAPLFARKELAHRRDHGGVTAEE